MTVWSIAQLERTTATGGVTIAHWRATATDGDYSASFIRHLLFYT
jgi:hypothetical protein